MKITSIETIPIRVPLAERVMIRSGRGGKHTDSPFLLVKVKTDSGLEGVGEVSCTPRWSGEDQFTAGHLIHTYLEPLLLGKDPRNIEELWPKFRLAFAGNNFTKAGVEMALWDIAGKAAGQPVFKLLGGKVREYVPTKWSVSGLAPAQAAAIGREAFEKGFRAMKVKVGIELEEDVARVVAVRQEVGPVVKLGVDANGGWDARTALAALERLANEDIAFVEQPLTPDDPEGMAELRRKLKMPLIADESLCTLRDARILAKLEAADVFSIYLGKAGGIGEARKIAQFAQQAGIRCTVGSNLELGVGSAAMIHLAIATGGIDAELFPCDIIGPFYYHADVVRKGANIIPGRAFPTDAPGLGIELDDEQIEAHRVRPKGSK